MGLCHVTGRVRDNADEVAEVEVGRDRRPAVTETARVAEIRLAE